MFDALERANVANRAKTELQALKQNLETQAEALALANEKLENSQRKLNEKLSQGESLTLALKETEEQLALTAAACSLLVALALVLIPVAAQAGVKIKVLDSCSRCGGSGA